MSLSPAFLDELRHRTLLSGLIGKTTKLQKAGREFRACCPFHNEKSPSFYVNDDKGFYHCLAADTVVVTRRGRMRIADLSGQRAEVLGPSGRWIESPFADYGSKRLWEIGLTRNGVAKTILATSRHRWFVRGRRSEVLTRDLVAGSRLESAQPESRDAWSIDPAGVRHGIVFGDGTMYKSVYGTLNLHGADNMELSCWFPEQRHVACVRENGQPYLRIYGGRAFEGMKALPSPSASDPYLLGFLAGYIAADGHVSKDGTVMLNSARGDHLDAVRDIALALGIVTYGRTTQSRIGIDGRVSDLHRIHFATSGLSPDLFLKDEARRRFVENAKAFDRLRWTVQSVTPTDRVENVYCAQVPEDHAFALDDNILTGNCFGCGAHGDAIRWLTDNRGLPFIDAVKELAQTAGLEMPAMDRKAAEKAERAKGLTEAMMEAASWFTSQLQGIAGGDARAVLEKRGVKPETAATFGLGFAPDSRGKLKDALKDYGDPTLVEAGLLIAVDGKAPYDRFRGRLMIPIRDARSRVIAFGGRIIGEGEPKYLNSPETPLFDKGRTLYNIDRALPAARKANRVIVVEGYMDVIALAQGGIDEAVAPLGTALTEHQLERLWQMADVPILCFDGDTAGQKAAIRAAQRALPLLKPGKSLAFATLPPGLDPDDVIGAGGRKAFEGILNRARSLDEFLWISEFGAISPMAGPDERGSLLHRLNQIADTIADPILKSQYRDTFRERFYGVFGSKAQRFSVVQAASEPVQRPRKGLAYSIQRAVLLGLMRYPEVLKARIEDVVDLPLGSRALIDLRDRLVELAIQWSAADIAEITHDILSETFGLDIAPRSYTEDLAFTFYFSRDAFAEARSDLERTIDLLVEEHLARRAVALVNAEIERDLSEHTYQEQQVARRLVDDVRSRLAEWVEQFRTAA